MPTAKRDENPPTPDGPRSPRRHRFPTRLLGLAITALVLALYWFGNPLLDVLELKTYDMRLLRLPSSAAHEEIAIAAIDEKSLAKLGRWPWDRATQARIVERLDRLGAHVIALDVFYAETEDAADERLRRAIADSGRAVLPIVFLMSKEETRHIDADQSERSLAAIKEHEISITRHHGDSPLPAFDEPLGLLINHPRIQTAAKYAGHINAIPDADGSLRWAPLAIPYKGHFFPSADVQAVRAYAGGQALTIRTNPNGIEGLDVGGRFIPTDTQGRALIRYYGPERTFPTFSVADVLERDFDPQQVKNRIVLIGPTSKGIGDIRVTPYSPALPGVEVRATVAQNLLRNEFIRLPGWAVAFDLLLLLALGGGLSFALPRLRLVPAAALIVVLAAVHLLGTFQIFQSERVWLSLTYPIFLLVLLFISTTLVQYFLTERERRQIKSAFQYYLHPKLVEEVIQDIEQLKLGGTKRELTVLFSDIRGFTATTESLAPEELVQLLNHYLTRMTEEVFHYDGYLDKYIGDAVMAVYGAPIPRADHAERACRSALAMMRELRGLQEQWRREKRPVFDIGIGINTGTMIVGNMGSKDRFNYTVIGDAVNLGSRVEHLNKDYGTHVLITEFTYAQVRDAFAATTREIDITTVRGRAAPVRLYELIPEGEYKHLDWLADFDKARALFHEGKAAKARPIFDKLVKAVNDPVSRYYLGRMPAAGKRK